MGQIDSGRELLLRGLDLLKTELGTGSMPYRHALQAYVHSIANEEEHASDYLIDLRADLVECYRVVPLARGALGRRRDALPPG